MRAAPKDSRVIVARALGRPALVPRWSHASIQPLRSLAATVLWAAPFNNLPTHTHVRSPGLAFSTIAGATACSRVTLISMQIWTTCVRLHSTMAPAHRFAPSPIP